jgi:hypothetical protein
MEERCPTTERLIANHQFSAKDRSKGRFDASLEIELSFEPIDEKKDE